MIFRLEFELLDGRLRYRVCDGGSHLAEADEALHFSMLGRWTVDVKPVSGPVTEGDKR